MLGLGQVEFVLGLSFLCVCLFLMIHALAPLRPGEKRLNMAPWMIAGLLLLETLALGLWMMPTLGLVGWMFLFGDNERLYAFWGPVLMGLILALSLGPAGIVAVRIARSGSFRMYRIHLVGSLVLLFGAVCVYGVSRLQTVDGLTAEGAARSQMQRVQQRVDVLLTLREAEKPPVPFAGSSKEYFFDGPMEPRGRVVMLPHDWIGWHVVESHVFPPSQQELERARAALAERNYHQAKLILQQIMEDYSGSPAFAEAQELMLLAE